MTPGISLLVGRMPRQARLRCGLMVKWKPKLISIRTMDTVRAKARFTSGRHYDRYTTGIIDEVLLFNVALDEADMETLMDDGIQSVTAVEPVDKLATTWGRIKRQ